MTPPDSRSQSPINYDEKAAMENFMVNTMNIIVISTLYCIFYNMKNQISHEK